MDLLLSQGSPLPLGSSLTEKGINFSLYAPNSTKTHLILFDSSGKKIQTLVLNPEENKTGKIWHIEIHDKNQYTYLWEVSDKKGVLHKIFDPYSKGLLAPHEWENTPYSPKSITPLLQPYDWQDSSCRPRYRKQDLIIYEMHVRGFTQHNSSNVNNPGTFLGLIEKIPYLKSLGINAVELLPVYEFNPFEPFFQNKSGLCNFWGYSTVQFFSPAVRFGSSPDPWKTLEEFQQMVDALHQAGIQVILDVVYNHSATLSKPSPFRFLDENGYYLMTKDGHNCNFTGCGNTLNGGSPVFVDLLISSLRFWAQEMHVDGFRFDLASALKRTSPEHFDPGAFIIRAIAEDPLLSDCHLIAEPWDAACAYEVGSFYQTDRFSEWNGKYRDTIREFINSEGQQRNAAASKICGSQDSYDWKSPLCSINFITCHDGFTLHDLVSYQNKHNEDNQENNQDGCNSNFSNNYGFEGITPKPTIIQNRERQQRNFFFILLLSQGIPMILMGDEYGASKNGNNNTYCHDSEINWFNWDLLQKNQEQFHFVQYLIEIRKSHPIFRRKAFLTDQEISWHGTEPNLPDWDNQKLPLCYTLHDHENKKEYFHCINPHKVTVKITPPLPFGGEKESTWQVLVDTHKNLNNYIEKNTKLPQKTFSLLPYTSILCVAE